MIITASKAKLKLLNKYIGDELSKISDSIYMANSQGLGFTYHDLRIEDFRDNLVHNVVTHIYNALTDPEYNYEVDIKRHINKHDDYYRLKITWNNFKNSGE